MVPPYKAFTQCTCMPPPPLPQPTHSHTHACMQRPPAPADRLKQCQVCQEKLGAAPRVVSLPCGHDFCADTYPPAGLAPFGETLRSTC